MATRDLNQVVRLTRCLDVPGHTAKLVRVMTEAGYRWYPEYTVEEQFRDFNQSQYLCTVRIFSSYPGSTEPLHCSYGLGVTIEMYVQDAAYSMMTIIRARTALLQNTDFRYMPASLSGAHDTIRLCTMTLHMIHYSAPLPRCSRTRTVKIGPCRWSFSTLVLTTGPL